VHRRLLPRHRFRRARRVGLPGRDDGPKVSDIAREWFAENRYQDYLYLHGLGVEMAEAMAEFVHKRIRSELGFAAEDAREIEAMLARLSRQPLFLRLSGLPAA
jgi:5-methyltetrahydrofolate--homocysteine methyltransferase